MLNGLISDDEDEDKRMEAVYEELAENQKLEMQSKNWERVFDLTPLNNDWAKRGASIQATFWELKKSIFEM